MWYDKILYFNKENNKWEAYDELGIDIVCSEKSRTKAIQLLELYADNLGSFRYKV